MNGQTIKTHLMISSSSRLQDENDDEDEWNPCKAAGVCLMLLANCTENDIVPHVVPFITSNITVEDWHSRDAAVMAFGKLPFYSKFL